ncbi:hypothetical protein HK102_013740 [Quaeritorhiza haematococci]|nr:hypothetical protein HK102_013740 [Quaeritorhiza haematococci]
METSMLVQEGGDTGNDATGNTGSRNTTASTVVGNTKWRCYIPGNGSKKRARSSPLVGMTVSAGGSGGTVHNLGCPPNSIVTWISGRAGSELDSLGFTCNDINNTTLGPVGGSGGKAFEPAESSSGFEGLRVKHGTKIDRMEIRSGSETWVVGGSGGDTVKQLQCPEGAKISGFQVNAGAQIDGLKAFCSERHIQ